MSDRHSSQIADFPLVVGLMKILHGKRHSANQGLTIMECLVAILLIGLTTAMITPPLVVATATRVQNRRAEQALQLAQDEVDRVLTLVQQGVHTGNVLPAAVGNTANLRDSVPAPTRLSNYLKSARKSGCVGTTVYNYQAIIPANEALPVDVDGDCEEDFFVQVFRTSGVLTKGEAIKLAPEQRPAKFDLGVRVYSRLAENNLSTGKLGTEPASLQITQGQGKQASNPLAVVYRPIIWSEQSDALCESLSATAKAALTACE
ncbi:MAG: type II secretion system protein [Cyanobacteria bacterium RM1_2_2]|nr:type II secretion system protein [Cyanobacteria bacterium RM1_2_2]